MASSSFKSSLTITHISTAAAVLEIDGINILTDPIFDPAGSEYDLGIVMLKLSDDPAVKIDQLPPIDLVLLSHEDHPDNLDPAGRTLLNGRRVITTIDGAKNLQPRPGVTGIQPWETISLELHGKTFKVTGTPCKHLPGGECTGFVLESPTFGTHSDGLPNAIYISGDTIYIEELATIGKKWHISAAILNLGAAVAPLPSGPLTITMDGKQASQLFGEIGADVLIPMHFESWAHFSQSKDDLKKAFQEHGVEDKVHWLTPGVAEKIL